MANLALATKPEMSLSYHTSGEIIYWHFHTGDWLEIATPSGLRWIASRAVIQGPFEQPINLNVSLTEQSVYYATPLDAKPSAAKLHAQTAIVREQWNDWLYVAASEGMIWIREADLPYGALTTTPEEDMSTEETASEETSSEETSSEETAAPTEEETTAAGETTIKEDSSTQ